MGKKATRLTPKSETLRQLFLKSGNQCAFPKCDARMMDKDGVFIGQLCHIEAAEYGGWLPNAIAPTYRLFSALVTLGP
jgi:hypothetical protein